VCRIVGESVNPNISFDRDATALIGELVWRKLQEMGSDLEYFAKHAKRTTIKSSDVLLLTRRNSSLVRIDLFIDCIHFGHKIEVLSLKSLFHRQNI